MEIGVNSGMVDGGANIGITSYEVARLYGRVVREYKRPLVISGVGGIETQAYHFADFGPILGNMALLHSASVTIISVSAITQRGFVVLYDATSVRLVDEKGKVLLGEYDPDTKLFYIDIGSVLRHTNSDEMVETNEEMSSQMEGASVNEAKTTAKRKSKRGEMIAKWLVEAVFDLHNRLSHPAARIMSKAVQDRAWIGVHPDITPAVIDKVFEKRTCLPCALGKMHRLVTPVGSGVRETVPGRRLSYDILGKISPATYNNGHFVHLFVCEAVGFLCKYVTKNKNRFTAANCVAATVAFFAQHGHKVAEIKFDAGATENSDYLKMCFAELTIAPHPIAFDTQRQNTVERYAQTCYQRVATVMLNQMVLGASTWGHALDVDIETLNCTPNELTGADTPYFLVTGRRPDVSRMFKFGFGQLLSCYDSEQESFSKGVLAVSLGWGQGNGATYVIIPGRGLRRFERYDVVPVKVSILQATASQIEGAQPRTAADGSTEFFSPVTSEIDQSFVATYGRHGGAPSRNISETAAGALDPSISGPLESSSTGSGEHKQAPAMRVLDKVHQMMQDMWRSCVMLVENEADLTADEEPKARAAGGEELSSEDLSMDDPSEKGVVVVGSDGEPALGEIVGMSGERENGAVVDHDLQVEDEMQAVMDDGSEDKSRRRPEKPSFEKPVTRSQTRPKASGAKGHVAMEKRVLEMTETRPQPFAFAFSARKWSTADNRNALSPPLLKQVFGAHWREDLTFEENLAGDVLSVGASHETPRSPDWIEGMKMKAIADAAVFVARVKATRSRRHDEDNPTLAQGLAFDPGKWGGSDQSGNRRIEGERCGRRSSSEQRAERVSDSQHDDYPENQTFCGDGLREAQSTMCGARKSGVEVGGRSDVRTDGLGKQRNAPVFFGRGARVVNQRVRYHSCVHLFGVGRSCVCPIASSVPRQRRPTDRLEAEEKLIWPPSGSTSLVRYVYHRASRSRLQAVASRSMRLHTQGGKGVRSSCTACGRCDFGLQLPAHAGRTDCSHAREVQTDRVRVSGKCVGFPH